MKKKNIIKYSIVVIALLGFISIFIYGRRKNTFVENGVTYALTVNGVKQNSFPSKGMYRVDTECSNATCKWDYDEWKLYIENITGEVSCNISFTTISKTYLNSKIIGLVNSEQGNGIVVNEKGYRYEGQNPNNYIWFNNEMWRIIGVFDSTSHGVSNINLVKIIRRDSIGGLSWNKNNYNNWPNSSLYKILNQVSGDSTSGAYYNAQDVTENEYCYEIYVNSGLVAKSKCDYRETGIKTNFRNMIKEVTWYLGGYAGNVTAEALYGYERNASSKYSSNASSINAKIGLMYASDYGYAVPSESCSRNTLLYDYSNSLNCTLNNWIYGQGDEWTITHYISSPYIALNIRDIGNVNHSYYTYFGYTVRPTLYLDASVYVLDGDGSESDPYIIGM